MDEKSVFNQLIKYFPTGEERRLYSNILAYSEACLSIGDFAEAEIYSDILISQDQEEQDRVSAYRIKMFARLGCRTEEEFVHSIKFNKDLPEYLDLIASTSDLSSLNRLINLANQNIEMVKQDRERQQKEQKMARPLWGCLVSFLAATLIFLIGVICWIALGETLPYLFPVLWVVFLASVVLYIVGIMFARSAKNLE